MAMAGQLVLDAGGDISASADFRYMMAECLVRVAPERSFPCDNNYSCLHQGMHL
jgi:hypothetical protein